MLSWQLRKFYPIFIQTSKKLREIVLQIVENFFLSYPRTSVYHGFAEFWVRFWGNFKEVSFSLPISKVNMYKVEYIWTPIWIGQLEICNPIGRFFIFDKEKKNFSSKRPFILLRGYSDFHSFVFLRKNENGSMLDKLFVLFARKPLNVSCDVIHVLYH